MSQLVGAAGASAVAVYSFQTGNGILDFHASYKGTYTLQVAVAAASESDTADDIGLSLYVYEFGADKGAGLEDGAAYAVLGCIGYEGYVKHIQHSHIMCHFWYLLP